MKNVWMLTEEYDNGHRLRVFSTKKKALECFHAVIKEYADDNILFNFHDPTFAVNDYNEIYIAIHKEKVL